MLWDANADPRMEQSAGHQYCNDIGFGMGITCFSEIKKKDH
jgi:hypothetical protein